ncbi:MAG: insulinase family protein [Candidatus Omnitrophica bacterium]|nr:insulinase family protein [Candidatus Omnitrophota bacterium]MCA9428918.1 insulinase family protein [Candidatus Omnitrophota bacterium]
MSLLIKRSEAAPLAAVDLWVATGTSHEEDSEVGISHFLEHLFFKGTPTRPVGVMDREVKTMGGYNNAATSYDFTHYYIVLPADHVELAMEVLVDALLNMALPPEEIERERQVVLEEISRKDDSPHGKLYDDFLSVAFEGTPYSRPILGTPESLQVIGRDQFNDYRHRRYSPENIHLAVCGQVDPEAVLSKAERLFEPLPKNGSNGISAHSFHPKPKTAEFEIKKDVQQTYLCWGVPTHSIQGTEDEIALDILSTVLGDGRSSRLVSRLVESTGLCSGVSAFVWVLSGVGLFAVEASYDGGDEKAVLDIISEEFDRIRQEPVPEKEFEKARSMLLAQNAYGLERLSSKAGVLARSSAFDLLDLVVAYPERIRSCTPSHALEAIQRCCPRDREVRGFVRPENRS